MSGYIPVELQRSVRARFFDCCAYCLSAEAMTVTVFEYEHVLPVSAGGETTEDNLCLSCPMCNRYKSNRTTAIDPVGESQTALFHPCRDQWNDHFGWNDEYTMLIGLTPTGRATIVALKMNRPQMIRIRSLWVLLGEHPPSESG